VLYPMPGHIAGC